MAIGSVLGGRPADEIRTVDKLLVDESNSDRPPPRQRADRALARPGPLSRRLRACRRLQPAAGPARRRGHPVHPRPCHGAAVLAIARLAVHRALSTEQRPRRLGPSRLGVPRGRPHLAAPAGRIWLAHNTIRDAARDFVSGAARVRRVRRVELVLRVRGRAGHPLAARGATGSVPVDRGVLRDAPALPEGAVRACRSRRRQPARLPARPARRARGPGRLLRLDLGGRRRGRADCSTPWPRRDSTARPGWCS